MADSNDVTRNACDSRDMDQAIARIVQVSGQRFTIFGQDRVARDYANDVVSARALARFHGGYAKDESGRIYAARCA